MEAQQGNPAPYRGVFRDRHDAGARLAERLKQYRGQGVLVLGIPRGGVVVAAEIARRLDAELDVVVARKVGAPISPELAIGAVTANGGKFLNEALIRQLGVSDAYLEMTIATEMAEARRREQWLGGASPGPDQGAYRHRRGRWPRDRCHHAGSGARRPPARAAAGDRGRAGGVARGMRHPP